MELKIVSPTEDGFIKAIEWNHEEIKAEVAEKVKMYTDLVYTEDQVKDAKADRAKLNKFVQALEAKRKEIKKQCMMPYEDFERQMKEIVAIVSRPIGMIDTQLKEYDEKKKAKKLEDIKEAYESIEMPDFISFDRIFDKRWLNTTFSMKKVTEEILAVSDRVRKDMITLESLPEFAFEAQKVYMESLDIGSAIAEAKRMSEIQKAKQAKAEQLKQMEEERKRMIAEREAAKAAEDAAKLAKAIADNERNANAYNVKEDICNDNADVYIVNAKDDNVNAGIDNTSTGIDNTSTGIDNTNTDIDNSNATVDSRANISETGGQASWVNFKALLTVPDALALKEFFQSRGIEFAAI